MDGQDVLVAEGFDVSIEEIPEGEKRFFEHGHLDSVRWLVSGLTERAEMGHVNRVTMLPAPGARAAVGIVNHVAALTHQWGAEKKRAIHVTSPSGEHR